MWIDIVRYMTLDKLHESVRITNGTTMLEASGNVSLESVLAIATTGVNIVYRGQADTSSAAYRY